MTPIRNFLYRFDLPLLTLALLAIVLSACEMTSPSHVSTSPIEVRHGIYHEMLEAKNIDAGTARAMADHYGRYGQGPVSIDMIYVAGQPEGPAARQAARLADLFRKAGMTDVRAGTLPLEDSAQNGFAIVQYTQVTARGPRRCAPHPGETRDGLAANEDGQYPDYRYGCTIDRFIAEQVVRPRDLAGGNPMSPTEGERAAARLKDYRDGKDTKDLSATNASDE